MTKPIDLLKPYTPRITAWVEDALASEYLCDCWNVSTISCRPGGSCESIAVMVHDAATRHEANVFGVVDRDFRESNAAQWTDLTQDIRCFVLPAHEIENYLLDAEALAGCDANNQGRSQAAIEARMQARAQQLVWWMACRHTIKRIDGLCTGGFLDTPSPGAIVDLASAASHITGHAWFAKFPADSAQIVAAGNVANWVNQAHAFYATDLAGDAWKISFSGKEVFRDAHGFIYRPPKKATSPNYDVDVAKSVARWQVAQNRIPADITNLLAALQARAI